VLYCPLAYQIAISLNDRGIPLSLPQNIKEHKVDTLDPSILHEVYLLIVKDIFMLPLGRIALCNSLNTPPLSPALLLWDFPYKVFCRKNSQVRTS
jgi:hypothetical protein